MSKKVFTLIELLIVIVIILILAAMLLPALSKVRYRAKLVICMSNQKQIALGATTYASENSGRWPYRGAYDHSADTMISGIPWASALKGGNPATNGFDDRPMLSEIFPINDTQCPFIEPLDIANSTHSQVVGGYGFHFGWKYQGSANKGMLKIGDNMVLGSKEFDVIVYDFTHTKINGWARSSHPDYGTNTMELNLATQAYWSRYLLDGTHMRGPVDLNFARKDGSAFMVRGVQVQDPRLQKVPYNFPSWSFPSQFSIMPDASFAQ